MKSIRQEDFTFIAEYAQQNTKTVAKFAICKSLKKEDKDARIEEVFIMNLHPDVEYEMSKMGESSMKGILHKISECEKIILRQSKLNTQAGTEQLNDHNTQANKNSEKATIKWCSVITPDLITQLIVKVFHQNQ